MDMDFKNMNIIQPGIIAAQFNNPTNPTNLYPTNNGGNWNNPTTLIDQDFEQICE
jgi:hypothetical protein